MGQVQTQSKEKIIISNSKSNLTRQAQNFGSEQYTFMSKAQNEGKDKKPLKAQMEPELIDTPSNPLYQHPFSNHHDIHSRHNESPEEAQIKPRWNNRTDLALKGSPEGLVTLKTSAVGPVADMYGQGEQFNNGNSAKPEELRVTGSESKDKSR